MPKGIVIAPDRVFAKFRSAHSSVPSGDFHGCSQLMWGILDSPAGSKAEKAMARTSIGNAHREVIRAKVDQIFLRMNRREIGIVSSVIRHSQPRALSAVLRTTNRLCDGWIYLLFVLWLSLQREWRLMLVAGLGTAVSFVLYFSTKPRFARMRPCHFAESLSTETRYLDLYSFPSGHCMTMSVVSVLLCWQHHAAIPPLAAMMFLLSLLDSLVYDVHMADSHHSGRRDTTLERLLKKMKRSPSPGRQLSFEATLENWAEGMDYCAVPLPRRLAARRGHGGLQNPPSRPTSRLGTSFALDRPGFRPVCGAVCGCASTAQTSLRRHQPPRG